MEVSDLGGKLRRAHAVAAIQQLCADYLDRADHDDTPSAADLFTEDGFLQLGSLRLAGKRDIARFFVDRAAQQHATSRTVRHLSGPPTIRLIEQNRGLIRSTIAVFAGEGSIPLASSAPATIFDFVDEVVCGGDDVWLFVSRRADVIFTGAGAASFVRPTETAGED